MPDDALRRVVDLRRLDQLDAAQALHSYRSRCLPDTRGSLRVGHLVPTACKSFCRILPALQVSGARESHWRWERALDDVEGDGRPGTLLRDFNRAARLLGKGGILLEPLIGEYDIDTLHALCRALGSLVDSDAAVLYYYWGGRADVGQNRMHNVYAGALSVASHLYVERPRRRFVSPSAFWSEDLAWAVAMHTDSPAVYVGGSDELMARLLAENEHDPIAVQWSTEVDLWTLPSDRPST